MKFGVNTFVWVSPLSTAAATQLAPKVKNMGFDILELACESPELIDVPTVKRVLAEHGLEAIVCGAWGPDRDIASKEPSVAAASRNYIRWLIDAAARVGFPDQSAARCTRASARHISMTAPLEARSGNAPWRGSGRWRRLRPTAASAWPWNR